MSKFLITVILIVIIIVGVLSFVFFSKNFREKESMQSSQLTTEQSVSKKIVMIIAFRSFRDEEYFIPKEEFEKAGFEVVTASSETGTAIGAGGGDTNVDLLMKDLNVENYDAVVFIGGPGAYKYIDDKEAHRIAKEAIEHNKVLAAICIAPAILARAGALEGRRATVWSNILDKSAVKILEENGAMYEEKPVVEDGKIITANGPQAARDFAKKIIEALTHS
ncbi:DJ-1/PfpI family protein [bacterium]|nr:DJ-1/PfpI family protein [bacterium]